MVSLHSIRNTKTEVGTRDWGVAVIGLTMFLFEEIQTLGLWIRKLVDRFKCCLMGHPNRNREDSDTECDLNYGCLDQELPVENMNMWPRGCSKSVAAFCPCLQNLPASKVMRFILILLAEEVPKQPSIDCDVVISGNSNEDL